MTERCVAGTKQGGKQKKRYTTRQAARQTLICPKKTPLLLNKNPAALARSQAPIVYHTRVQIWRRHDWTKHNMSWASRLASEPHGDDVQHPAWSV